MSVPPTIALDLPSLTPAEADLLWSFIQDLETKLWDAYAPQLVPLAQRDLDAPNPDDDINPHQSSDGLDF